MSQQRYIIKPAADRPCVCETQTTEDGHPVAAALAGATIGAAVGGPVGMVIGGVIGALAGSSPTTTKTCKCDSE